MQDTLHVEEGYSLVNQEGVTVATVQDDIRGEARAKRFVAVWNACDGTPTAAPDLVDELATALKEYHRIICESYSEEDVVNFNVIAGPVLAKYRASKPPVPAADALEAIAKDIGTSPPEPGTAENKGLEKVAKRGEPCPKCGAPWSEFMTSGRMWAWKCGTHMVEGNESQTYGRSSLCRNRTDPSNTDILVEALNEIERGFEPEQEGVTYLQSRDMQVVANSALKRYREAREKDLLDE